MTHINEATLDFIKKHENAQDIYALLMRKDKLKDVDVKMAVQQIEGRRKARTKFPRLMDAPAFIFPDKIAIEQASSETAALYKSQLTGNDKTLIDTTGGMGIDSIYFAFSRHKVTYVERNTAVFDVARHNFSALSLSITCVNDDSMNYLSQFTEKYDWLYADPARRDTRGKKVFRLSDCEPDVSANLPMLLSKASNVMLKLSPMLDITQGITDLNHTVSEVHILSVDNECKELLFICQHETNENPRMHCINMMGDRREAFTCFAQEEENAEQRLTDTVQSYLYEPNVSILKAGAFKLLCERYGVAKLHVNTHLYTSDELRKDFPGRIFRVEHVFPLNTSSLNRYLPEMKANVTVRNFPLSVAEIRKKYRIKEGGDTYLFAASVGVQKQVVMCKKVKNES